MRKWNQGRPASNACFNRRDGGRQTKSQPPASSADSATTRRAETAKVGFVLGTQAAAQRLADLLRDRDAKKQAKQTDFCGRPFSAAVCYKCTSGAASYALKQAKRTNQSQSKDRLLPFSSSLFELNEQSFSPPWQAGCATAKSTSNQKKNRPIPAADRPHIRRGLLLSVGTNGDGQQNKKKHRRTSPPPPSLYKAALTAS